MEIKTAQKWYRWLWLSPILTLPTWGIFYIIFYSNSRTSLSGSILPVLISGMWHLILLKPATDKTSKFVRWHGRQALLLAGIRTFLPIIFIYRDDNGFLDAIPFIGIIWFVGTLFSQLQARNGYCFLWRWFGKTDSNTFPYLSLEPVQEINQSHNKNPDALVEIIRFNPDPDQRRMALEELKKLELVERMDGESEPIS